MARVNDKIRGFEVAYSLRLGLLISLLNSVVVDFAEFTLFCFFQATVSELWFVEEYDVLALALNGRMKTRRFHLGCGGGDRNHST